MQINEIHCKSILTRVTGYLKTVASHSVNPYVGCGFGRSSCGIGCYVQHNPWLMKGREWGTFVDVKVNASEIYLKTWHREKQWAYRRSSPFTLFFSSSTDPWQPIEKRFRVSRELLNSMLQHPPDRLILQTHTASILEDRLLIIKLSKICDVRVHVSLEGDLDQLPDLPSPPSLLEERMKALETFASAGVAAVACVSPLYPIKDPPSFFNRLVNLGIRGVIIDHFIQGDGTSDGSRTFKTNLPSSMARVDAESIHLSYRDTIARIAKNYLPVGISQNGFAGKFD